MLNLGVALMFVGALVFCVWFNMFHRHQENTYSEQESIRVLLRIALLQGLMIGLFISGLAVIIGQLITGN